VFRMKPKLILFDFSGTLAYLRSFDLEEFFSYLEKFGLIFLTEREKEDFIKLCQTLWGWAKDWNNLSYRLLKNYIGKPTQSLVKNLSEFLKEKIIFELYEDVKEIIDLPFQKAILSGNAKFIIEDLGLEKFAKIFTPKETKFLKPDPQAFLTPLKEMKTKPEEALMIGDELERDLIPAKNLGLEVILIDRENKIKNSPVKKINSLKELKEILGP